MKRIIAFPMLRSKLSPLLLRYKYLANSTNSRGKSTPLSKRKQYYLSSKRYDVQEMYMKPPQKLKRILRVKVGKENVQGQELLKIFGYIFPRK